MMVASIAIMSQHIILTYHIIQRDYMLYISFPGRKHILLKEEKYHYVIEEEMKISSQEHRPDKRIMDSALTRKHFEDYFKKHKPYLNQNLKITDLVYELQANRTYISDFINRTYGMNFNRFINHCRLLELNKLMKSPSNHGKPLKELIQKAGFTDIRHYNRTIQPETGKKREEEE